MRNSIIEEKLQKLGVEKGLNSGLGQPEPFAAHGRAASVRMVVFITRRVLN